MKKIKTCTNYCNLCGACSKEIVELKRQKDIAANVKDALVQIKNKTNFQMNVEKSIDWMIEALNRGDLLRDESEFMLYVYNAEFVKKVKLHYSEFLLDGFTHAREMESARLSLRLDRLRRQVTQNAPKLIIDGEHELIFKAMTIIDILNVYIKRCKNKEERPEEKLLRVIFGIN